MSKLAAGRKRPSPELTARLDLGRALLADGRHDEAAAVTMRAVTSGRLVPSNYWRAGEIVSAVTERGLPEGADLAAAYRQTCRNEPTRRSWSVS